MKICLTTYICGDKYQDFIPLIIYSVKKAYPDYYLMIFIKGKIRSDLNEIIEILRTSLGGDFEIIEHTFDDCKIMTPIAAQSFRWVIWSDKFLNFDYLYFIDADIFYIKEPIPLHEQHIRHMQYIGEKGISNIVRVRETYANMIIGLYNNYKYAGIKSIFYYFLHRRIFRMSGIHFVQVKEYYSKISRELLSKYKDIIYKGEIYKNTGFANDEALLYNMIKESGWDMSRFAFQKSSTSMFGFNNPEKKEFCPHHGIHLGIFRRDIQDIKSFAIKQLESDDYKYYIDQFKQCNMNDELFKMIFQMLSPNIKLYFNRMYQYYKL